MAAKSESRDQKSVVKPNKDANDKNKTEEKLADSANKTRKGGKLKSGKPRAKVRKVSNETQGKGKQERQKPIKTQKDLAAKELGSEHEPQAQVKRDSFIVRLTVDERGQFSRTEIEHISSNRKQNFQGLDSDRLIAFIKACMSSAISQEPAESPKSPKKESLSPKIPTPKFRIVLTAVQVFPLARPDSITSRLLPEQSFIVQARFQLLGVEARSLVAQEHFFEVKVYTNEMTSGSTKLLTTYRAKLKRDVMEYDVRKEVPGLLPGLYRISTVIFLQKPVKIGGFYDKTIIHVI